MHSSCDDRAAVNHGGKTAAVTVAEDCDRLMGFGTDSDT
jgi:hypothetical protein